jgi:4'-phosphopantetheinyl transferase
MMVNLQVVFEKISSADFAHPEEIGRRQRDADTALFLLDVSSFAEGETLCRDPLSPDECERAARFHFEQDRLRFCAARVVLRRLLAKYLDLPARQITFQYSEKGKPGLSNHRGVAFNVSHSGDFALLGFTRRSAIGVDIEKIREDFDTAAIARRFFSEKEQKALLGLPEGQQHAGFFRCWTRKEAFIKALGEGLSHPLSQFDVSVEICDEVPLTTRPDAKESERWCLQSIDAIPGYAAAIAVSAS